MLQHHVDQTHDLSQYLTMSHPIYISCPRDAQTMASNEAPEAGYYSCYKCGGIWLPGNALRAHIIKEDLDSLSSSDTPTTPVLSCPGCRKPMKILNAIHCEIDLCLHCHGLWLDGGEVNKLRPLIKPQSQITRLDPSITKLCPETKTAAIVDIIVNIVLTVLRF